MLLGGSFSDESVNSYSVSFVKQKFSDGES